MEDNEAISVPEQEQEQECCPNCNSPYSEVSLCDCAEDCCTSCCTCNVCEHGPHHTTETICEICEYCPDHCNCPTCSRCNVTCETTCDNCERCDYCCHCSTCSNCDCRCDSVCSNCDYCDDCCDCSHCNRCDTTVSSGDYCCDCNRCNECCTCNEERVVTIIKRTIRYYKSNKLEFKTNPIKRFISCEIEIDEAEDGNYIEKVARKWGASIVEDGSLSNSGFEINTSPANGDIFLGQIEEFCDAFTACGAVVNVKCGLHVHIDARDFSYWDIRKLIILYAKIEEGLFSLVPLSRRSSDTCKKCGQDYLKAILNGNPKKIKDAILESLYKNKTATKTCRKEKYMNCRYNALNLHSWLYRGTIEFRLGGGTTNYDKITNWSLLLASIVDYVAKHSDKEILQLNGEELDILKQIVNNKSICEWIDSRFLQLNS